MADPKVVEQVLGERWALHHKMSETPNTVKLGETRAVVLTAHGGYPLSAERARQAALGHRALRLLVSIAHINPVLLDLNPELGAIIRELRGES